MADTTQKKRFLGGKTRMVATALTLLFTGAVLGVGFLSPYWMEKLVPSYLGTQVVTDKADAVGPVLAGADDITQYLYPWNHYDESRLREMTEEDYQFIQSMVDSVNLLSILLDTTDIETDFSDFFAGFRTIREEVSRYYYLKDWEVSVNGNRRWRVNFALSNTFDGLSYLRIQPVRTEQVTREHVNQTYQHLLNAAKLLEDIQFGMDEIVYEELPYPTVDSITKETLDRYWNYLQEMANILLKVQERMASSVFAALRSSNGTVLAGAEILRTDSEVMVIYNVYGIRLTLFVDPLTEEYTGFCVQN